MAQEKGLNIETTRAAKTALIRRIRMLAEVQRAVVPMPNVVRIFQGNMVYAMTWDQMNHIQPVSDLDIIDIPFINE